MKTAFFMLCMLCATAAFGQVGAVLNNEVQGFQMNSHDAHAPQATLAEDQNIRGNFNPIAVHGERPLWEVGQIKEEMSLGEAARIQRKEHANDKKAPVIWHN